jgi:hypothetical protein
VIVRPRGAPHASTPATVPEPRHHHLPAWVRRAYGQAQPILGDLAGSLEGDARQELMKAVTEVTELISSGKFSAAWRYPELIAGAQSQYEAQVKQKQAAERERKALENARRKAGELLRDPGVALAADVVTRLNRELRSAGDQAAVDDIAARIREAVASARTAQVKRREREIDRARARIRRAPAAESASEDGSSWQDVLLKLKQQMSRENGEEPAVAGDSADE